jgi:hypothetical protein
MSRHAAILTNDIILILTKPDSIFESLPLSMPQLSDIAFNVRPFWMRNCFKRLPKA